MVKLDILEKIRARLKVFDVITYKDICSLLNEPPKTGNSKKAHIKEFERYCQIETHGRGKFRVLKIYDMPKEKIGRGQHENSQKALKEYNDSNKVFQNDILRQSVLCFHFIKASSILGIPIIELRDTNNNNTFSVTIRPYEAFERVGLCNNRTGETLENKQDLTYNDIFLHYESLKPSYIVTNNLFNSMKNKMVNSDLKDIVRYERIIVYNNESRQALPHEEQIIKQVEQDVMKAYNKKHDTDYKYSDIYNMPKNQRMTIQNMKKHRILDKINDYEYDMKCFIINSSIKAIVQELKLYDMTEEEIIQLGEYLRQQVNIIYYENEKNRIIKYYDEQINEIRNSKAYGNIKQHKIDKLEQDKAKSLELLDYLIKVNYDNSLKYNSQIL